MSRQATPAFARRRHRAGRRAFSVVELLMVMIIMAIAFGLAMPLLGSTRGTRVREACRVLAAHIELAENESIAHADDPRLIKFDQANATYWIAAASDPDTPITDPVYGEPCRITFGQGRASGAVGVTMTDLSLGGDSELRFDAYGTPDQSTDAEIELSAGGTSMIVQVAADTGEASILFATPD